MKNVIINGIKTYAPESRSELINYSINEGKILIALNAEKILNSNSTIKNLINSNIGYPDGFGVILALNKKGIRNINKIPGCELWLDIINSYYLTKTFYLVGGTKNVLEETVKKLKIDYSGINILNHHDGYFDEYQKKIIIDDIKKLSPDIIFVAMGSPRQELFMKEIQKAHKALFLGLGGSFDVYTSKVKRAPKWWIDRNLEWLFRLISQPTRIKRQILLSKFLYKLYLNKF